MTLSVQQVPLQFVAQTWPLVEEHIESARKYGQGDYTIDQIKLLVSMGQWILMVIVDEEKQVHGAITSSFINYPNNRVAFITFIGGRLIASKDTFEQMCSILKANGATSIQGAVRPAVARLWSRFGFKHKTSIVEVKL
jgi:hypothetical protein